MRADSLVIPEEWTARGSRGTTTASPQPEPPHSVDADACSTRTGRECLSAHVQGVSAIRSLEMAARPGMRGQDRKVCDNLEAVEVQFLSPRCQDDAHAPRLRLTINVVKRA